MERATEAAGQRVGERLAAGETFGPARDWAWHKDAEGQTCAYVSLDLTGVGMQGPGGGGRGADGDRGDGLQPRRLAGQARYLAG